ncbi:FIST signal transduction protein [Nannocystis radixulma]|uniref:FIST N-terminal domain-containing protein n=1 Tax=Nannocystis radixulma TaxID=2995305 RepID=A0ABT5AYX0_9BACT|nr:FIST N-terminal domain-containing protein [Nannocystis radixulma]MDC0667040.1 FIST N-terminal domain-containing protein [Nannocystis radixulma]
MKPESRLFARAVVSRDKLARAAGGTLAREIRATFGAEAPAVALVYATVDHDQETLLGAVREGLGSTPIIGCSTSGLTGRGSFHEGNYAAGIVGLGGPALTAATAMAEDFARDTIARGHAVGRELRDGLRGASPRVVIVHGDPLCGADFESFTRAVQAELGCPAVGGGAGQPWGVFAQTYQYMGDRVRSGAAVAVALGGEFVAEIATSTGTEPTTSAATVTRTDGNVLLELDGRPALAVYSEFQGREMLRELDNEATAKVALGIEFEAPPVQSDALTPYVVRTPFALDTQRGGLVMAAPLPEGIRIVFHLRSIRAALDGAEQAARALARRLQGRAIRLVMGFECSARTVPLLGKQDAAREQALVQQALAPDAEWLGMLAWGEVAPYGPHATYYNFTYPMLALAE